MDTIIIITIYLIGCVLTYGRMLASEYEIDEYYIRTIPANPNYKFYIFYSIFSWIGFISGILIYFVDNQKYFLKFSYKDLIDYYDTHYN